MNLVHYFQVLFVSLFPVSPNITKYCSNQENTKGKYIWTKAIFTIFGCQIFQSWWPHKPTYVYLLVTSLEISHCILVPLPKIWFVWVTAFSLAHFSMELGECQLPDHLLYLSLPVGNHLHLWKYTGPCAHLNSKFGIVLICAVNIVHIHGVNFVKNWQFDVLGSIYFNEKV